MQQDKKFKISVDDAKIRDLRSTANELARDMIMSARQYSTSSKQVVQDIEEQIRLIEKRNKLDQEIERTKVESQFVSGDISKKQRKEQIGQIDVSGRTDELQVKLLREIIDTIRSTAKEEIREDRSNVERQIQKSKTVDITSPKGDAERLLIETIQRGELGDTGREEAEERRDFAAFGKGGQVANRALSTVAGAQSEFSVLAAGISAIPVVGIGMGIAANRMIQSASRFEDSAKRYGIITGTGIAGGVSAAQYMLPGDEYGFSPSDALERYTKYITEGQRAYGGEETSRLFGAERRLGLSQEQIGQVAGTSRYSGGDPSQAIMMFEAYLKKSDQNISLLPEILQTYTGVARNLLQISTDVDTQRVASNLASLGSVTGARGVGLDQWAGGVQGLGQTQNPMVRSMLMRAFMQKYPNKSMFEIQAMMERPAEHMDVVGDMVSEMQGDMGGDMGMQALYSTFGGKVSKSEILRATQGGADFAQLGRGGMDTSGSVINESASPYIGAVERSQKGFEDFFQTYGEKMVSAMEDLANSAKSMFAGGMDEQEKKVLEQTMSSGIEQGLENYMRKHGQLPQ